MEHESPADDAELQQEDSRQQEDQDVDDLDDN